MNRKTIASWCLYDFANSFYAVLSTVVWGPFYQRRIVGNEQGLGDLWWGYVISTTMLVVALSSPMMGAIGDYAGRRKRLLVFYTVTSVAALAMFTTVQPGAVYWGFLVSVISYVGFEGALVFYNAYLPEIAPRDYQGRVSGWGFAVGYGGSLVCLALALPFVQRGIFNGVWLVVAAAYLLFSLPAFLWLPADAAPQLGVRAAAVGGLRETWRTSREILRLRETRRFLLAYFIFEDGVNTVITFAPAFAAQTMGFSFTELLVLFGLVQASALVGAFLWAKPTDRLGPKRVVMIVLVQWSLVAIAAYFVQTKMQFFVVAVLAGTGLGAIQAASRAFMSTLIPKGREGDFFGFYTLCGKTGSWLGPLVFGQVSHATGNQRLAVLSVLLFFAIGGTLVGRVKAGGPTTAPAPTDGVTG
jgi:UMF1 family MFS transporter